jgi:hypothetical protein
MLNFWNLDFERQMLTLVWMVALYSPVEQTLSLKLSKMSSMCLRPLLSSLFEL